MKVLRTHLLLSVLTIGTLGYHAYNYLRGGTLRPEERLSFRPIQISLLGRSLKVAMPTTHSSGISVDSSASFIGGVGSLLRYYSGEVDSFAVRGMPTPYENLCLRGDVAIQYPSHRAEAQALASEIKAIVDDLEKQGVHSVVVPIPGKLAFYRSKFPSRLPPFDEWGAGKIIERQSERENPYELYRTLVTTDPKHVVDLYELYRQALSADPNNLIYVPWDYHWTSYGMNLTAQAVLDHLVKQGIWEGEVGRAKLAELRPAYFQDILLNHLRLPAWYLAHQSRFQWREPLYHLDGKPKDPTHDPVKRVVVLGTSFTNRLRDTSYSFGAQLHSVLGGTLIYDAEDGRPIRSLGVKQKKHPLILQRGDLLVWEFPFTQLIEGEQKLVPFIVENTPVQRTLARRSK